METHLYSRSCPVFRTTSRIPCCFANRTPMATCTGSVALTVYLGWSPIEQVPAVSPAVKLTGGQECVGHERPIGVFEIYS